MGPRSAPRTNNRCAVGRPSRGIQECLVYADTLENFANDVHPHLPVIAFGAYLIEFTNLRAVKQGYERLGH
jgi:hypothetical protein